MIPCQDCISNFFNSNNVENFNKLKMLNIEMNNDGYYEIICENGHEFISVVQQMKFEILFDFGVMSLNDGYSREAVMNFASALEKFFEFCIEVFLVEDIKDGREYDRVWKLVKNRSERQLGAFYFLFLSKLKSPPPFLDNWCIELRNKVVHQGYIPKSDEVIKYGESVFNMINDILIDLRVSFKNAIEEVVIRNLIKLSQKANNRKVKTSTISLPTILSLSSAEKPTNFNTAVENMKKNVIFQYTNTNDFASLIKDIDRKLGEVK